MESTTITVETVTVWTVLAFTLWLAMTTLFERAGLKAAVALAALLSWLVAGAAMSWLPTLLDWMSRHSRA
jgi:hypothetical protein